MSLSPAARHKLAVLATPAAAAHAAAAESLDSLHLRLVEFEQDKQVLKGFVQISEKVNHKRDVLIPKYKPLAEKYLAAGESYQNPIFTDLIVWLFDIGDLETAVEWLFKAIELNLPTPENFKRSSWAVFARMKYSNGQSNSYLMATPSSLTSPVYSRKSIKSGSCQRSLKLNGTSSRVTAC